MNRNVQVSKKYFKIKNEWKYQLIGSFALKAWLFDFSIVSEEVSTAILKTPCFSTLVINNC